MANRIIVDDNAKEYEVVNKRGVILGTFLINPTDFNIAARAEEAIEHIERIMADIEKNEVGDDENALMELQASGEAVKREVDYIFNANASEAFFSKVNPFSLVDGKFYIENVINAIKFVIKKEFKEELERSEQRIARYTNKYTDPTGENRAARRTKKKRKNNGEAAGNLTNNGQEPSVGAERIHSDTTETIPHTEK